MFQQIVSTSSGLADKQAAYKRLDTDYFVNIVWRFFPCRMLLSISWVKFYVRCVIYFIETHTREKKVCDLKTKFTMNHVLKM